MTEDRRQRLEDGRREFVFRHPSSVLRPPVKRKNSHTRLPSELVRRRPDILAAEAQLHSASTVVGAATAALFPSVTLNGNYGWNSTDFTTLFGPGATFRSVGTNLAAPVVHGGTLWFQRRAAIRAYEASLTDYQQTVVAGFQQAADSLRALETDARTLQAQSSFLSTRFARAEH